MNASFAIAAYKAGLAAIAGSKEALRRTQETVEKTFPEEKGLTPTMCTRKDSSFSDLCVDQTLSLPPKTLRLIQIGTKAMEDNFADTVANRIRRLTPELEQDKD